MKGSILVGAMILIASTALVIDSCTKKKDTTPPSITLLGSSIINQSLPLIPGTATWTEPGYTATDNQGNNLTASVIVTGKVNPDSAGTYQITYYVTDNSGIAAPYRIRVINIINDAQAFAGTYPHSTDACMSDTLVPPPMIIPSDSVDNLVWIANFGGLDHSGFFLIKATIVDTVMTIPVPQAFEVQGYQDTVTITNVYYSKIISAIYPTAIDIKYQWYNNTSAYDSCFTQYRR